MVTDKALALRVQRQGQFKLGMVVLLEGSAIIQPAVQCCSGSAVIGSDMFQIGLHMAYHASNRLQ